MERLTDNILTSIKKMLGIDAEYTHFDADITMHINSAFSTLTQIGVGPTDGFSIESGEETWDQFITEGGNRFSMVKSYVYLKVRLLFDPPASSAVIDAIKQQIAEYEWRLFVAADPAK